MHVSRLRNSHNCILHMSSQLCRSHDLMGSLARLWGTCTQEILSLCPLKLSVFNAFDRKTQETPDEYIYIGNVKFDDQTMAKNGYNTTLLASSISLLKNLCIFITSPILFLSDVLHIRYVFNKKSNDVEELEGQETNMNLDEEEEEELIEISLVREANEEKVQSVKRYWMSKEEYYEELTIMEICEEIEAEDNLIEIDISVGSIV